MLPSDTNNTKNTLMTDKQPLFVQMVLQAWEINIKRTNAVFDNFTDEELFAEIAPGKNRIVYLLGHLTAVHDRMLPILDFGDRLYTQLDDGFITNPDKVIKEIPPVKELRAWWKNINEVLRTKFNTLTLAEWFQKHTAMSEDDFVKEPYRNRLSVLISRTNHLSTHLGQLLLVKK
jgi:hypothetical protein